MFLMRFAIAATMKIMYAPLVVQLHLSRKQADKFYQILADAGIKSAKPLRAGKLRPEDAQPMEAELQTLLGAVGFAQYQDYIQNDMNDHVMLRQIRRDLASHPLSDPQLLQLWQAMKAARQTATANNPLDLSQANLSDRTTMVVQYVRQQQQQIFQNVLQGVRQNSSTRPPAAGNRCGRRERSDALSRIHQADDSYGCSAGPEYFQPPAHPRTCLTACSGLR